MERLALQAKDNPVFLCGGAANDEEVLDLFWRIVILDIDAATQKKELLNAGTTLQPHQWEVVREQPKRAAAYCQRLNGVLVDATQAIEVVTDEIVQKVLVKSRTGVKFPCQSF